MVIKFGKWVAKHKIIIIIAAVLLLIPATIGYISTRINYDVLSYLPKFTGNRIRSGYRWWMSSEWEHFP